MEHQNEEKIICAGWLRISSKKQLEGDSLDDQRAVLESYAQQMGYLIKYWFSSVHSATVDNVDDQPFQEVIKFCKENKIKLKFQE